MACLRGSSSSQSSAMVRLVQLTDKLPGQAWISALLRLCSGKSMLDDVKRDGGTWSLDIAERLNKFNPETAQDDTTVISCILSREYDEQTKLAMLIRLRDMQAMFNLKNSSGRTAISYVCEKGYKTLFFEFFTGKEADHQLNIKYDEPDNNGYSPFLYALKNGHQTIARYLMEKYVGRIKVDRVVFDNTAVSLCARKGLVELGQQICRSYPHLVNRRVIKVKRTAMHEAAYSGDRYFIEMLLQAGGTDLADGDGRTAQEIAGIRLNITGQAKYKEIQTVLQQHKLEKQKRAIEKILLDDLREEIFGILRMRVQASRKGVFASELSAAMNEERVVDNVVECCGANAVR
eukprot:TRINITY_DN3715_c0_g1_i1.p1 TRINITY_DN3715_c0_g1~~TRINITY_DN3715_c0_g1_i1.p1  ORF type:complete len:376 (+),score=65.34 TRINITY_DN3715_c0_g1_i1:89-1129(+)